MQNKITIYTPEKRHILAIYIDELQDYLRLPTSLNDALAQSRGLGAGWTLAHQFRNQFHNDSNSWAENLKR